MQLLAEKRRRFFERPPRGERAGGGKPGKPGKGPRRGPKDKAAEKGGRSFEARPPKAAKKDRIDPDTPSAAASARLASASSSLVMMSIGAAMSPSGRATSRLRRARSLRSSVKGSKQ